MENPEKGKSLYEYDPYRGSIEDAAKALSPSDLELYKLQRDNLEFNKLYHQFTGREWLGLYKRKHRPQALYVAGRCTSVKHIKSKLMKHIYYHYHHHQSHWRKLQDSVRQKKNVNNCDHIGIQIKIR